MNYMFNNNIPFYNPNMFQNNMTQFNAIGGNWRFSYYINNNNNNINNFVQQKKNDEKYSICFRTGSGYTTNIVMDEDKTISHLILVYLTRVGVPGFFNQPKKVTFLYNANTIKMDCQKTIKEFFGNWVISKNPTILVIDTKNLIGA